MITFKRGIGSFLYSLLVGVGGSVFIFFIASIFTENIYIVYGISIAFLLLMLSMTIFSENIKCEIENNELRYYKGKKLKEKIYLPDYYCGYKAKTSDGTADDLTLQLVKDSSDEEALYIDCTALGVSKFYKMYEEVEKIAKKQNTKMETIKKEDITINE